jgi:hypothetical protein
VGKRATTKSGIDIDTGARGLSYLQKELAVGGLMSQLLLERVSLERGRVITRAHQHSDLPEDFDSDLEPDVSRLQWALATQTVVDFLKVTFDGVVVFEHPFATPGAKWLSAKPVPYMTCENEVLFVVDGTWANPERADLALVAAGAQNEIGILTRYPDLSRFLNRDIDRSVVEELVANVQAIVLRAFDAEGYLVWQPIYAAESLA